MSNAIHFQGETKSNHQRDIISEQEPHSLRTFTPSQAVFAKSAGCFHWTPEGRRLYDYASGVLVSNLGHNPKRWMKKLASVMGWNPENLTDDSDGYFQAVTLTAYNAITEVEAEAVDRLVKSVQSFPGGDRLDTVMWAASGSEAVQKALWACLSRDPERDLIIATRYGFHGKKGLAGAVTGCETDKDRDPRVKFISFPREECDDMTKYGDDVDLSKYQDELNALWDEFGSRLNCLITEPYLGGGGSYHPPVAYMKILEAFCNEHDILLIFDEVQANFGRTGCMYAFEKYRITPDFVCMGKGLGNGIPVSATVGRGDIMKNMGYGATSDTWSANPLACASVIATLDEFEKTDVMENTAKLSKIFFEGLAKLKETGVISKVRGEGMVFGIQCADLGEMKSTDVANRVVEKCYLGQQGGDGIHLLGPLAGNVLRVSPPMTMTESETKESLELFCNLIESVKSEILIHEK